jgi:hypothetical protein
VEAEKKWRGEVEKEMKSETGQAPNAQQLDQELRRRRKLKRKAEEPPPTAAPPPRKKSVRLQSQASASGSSQT